MPHGNHELLEIQHKALKKPLKLCSFWLRDHCRCSNCYGETSQRKFNLSNIPLDIEPKGWNIDNECLNVKCESISPDKFSNRLKMQ